MGMFDYIRCEHPHFTIRTDGTLWRDSSFHGGNELGHVADYFGEMRIYTCGPKSESWWLEFRVRFVDGKIYGPIVLIEDSRGVKGKNDAS